MKTLSNTTRQLLDATEHMAMAMRLASAAVISDMETNAASMTINGQRWWDVRPMLDEREQPPECIDMAREAIAYAIDAEIVVQHPEQPHWLQIVRKA